MSNHAAGYLISAVLRKIDEKGLFDNLSKEEAAEIIVDAGSLVEMVDGNFPEAVAGIAEKYNICYYCGDYKHEGLNEDGLCSKCE